MNNILFWLSSHLLEMAAIVFVLIRLSQFLESRKQTADEQKQQENIRKLNGEK